MQHGIVIDIENSPKILPSPILKLRHVKNGISLSYQQLYLQKMQLEQKMAEPSTHLDHYKNKNRTQIKEINQKWINLSIADDPDKKEWNQMTTMMATIKKDLFEPKIDKSKIRKHKAKIERVERFKGVQDLTKQFGFTNKINPEILLAMKQKRKWRVQ
ncbi:Hypothetical_protein [Hexamita inflata]|uniref:Hypothetical_protein n=1 Tax=Hexamita inflata TaxID=28002 RepID=A0AA86QRE2_9EUKA|nr:Hypothetical protein HINF_LOCUS50855 [Hexamita inflata]